MEMIHTAYSDRNEGHYTPGIKHNGLLYISGQLSVDPETGKAAEGGVIGETRQALRNLELVLKNAGAVKQDVIQCRVYIPDIAYWDDVNKV